MTLTLSRQPYGHSTLRRSLCLTAETREILESLAVTGYHASAINLAVRLLGAVVSGDPTQAADVGEALAKATGWDTARMEEGLELVRCAVRVAVHLREEAMKETDE